MGLRNEGDPMKVLIITNVPTSDTTEQARSAASMAKYGCWLNDIMTAEP